MKKTIIFNKKDYKDFRDMYADIYKKLDGQHTIDFENLENLKYSRDILNEFYGINLMKIYTINF